MLFSLGLVSSSGTQDIKVGTIFPRSGPTAMLGEQARRGADLARKMVNEKGGVKGKPVVFANESVDKRMCF
jgi:branched-chain amino acid transport system substrate-binding protein